MTSCFHILLFNITDPNKLQVSLTKHLIYIMLQSTVLIIRGNALTSFIVLMVLVALADIVFHVDLLSSFFLNLEKTLKKKKNQYYHIRNI